MQHGGFESVDPSLFSGGRPPPAHTRGQSVRFHRKSVKNEVETAQQGRPIYEAVEYVEIRVPGDPTNVVDRPVRDSDRAAYAQQYAAFKAGDKEQVTGTPLEHWPPISAEQVLELKHFRVRTVEELAAVSDGNLANLGHYRALREQAKAWLEAAQGHAPVARLTAEKEALALEVAGLKEQMKSLEKALAKKEK